MTDENARAASTEVSWPLDDTTMYATLVKPAGKGPFPALAFVAGSGPTDRDWNSPLLPGTNGSARLLAEALAEKGFASIRYDKRAAGPHAQENFPKLIGKVSIETHVDELAGAVRLLAEQDDVDPKRIFALTNSEGALHALTYQVHGPAIPFAGIVLTAPPGRVMREVGRSQIAGMVASQPNSAELMTAYDSAIGQFEAGETPTIDPGLPQPAQMLLMGLSSPANLPFARELWMADVSALLMQVTVPVLVVIGKKDVQVHWQADGEPLRQAAGGRAAGGRAAGGRRDVEFVIPENANHVLKHEPRALADLQPAEIGISYNSPETTLDPEALAAIMSWLQAHA